jgi:hypothetical protein
MLRFIKYLIDSWFPPAVTYVHSYEVIQYIKALNADETPQLRHM